MPFKSGQYLGPLSVLLVRQWGLQGVWFAMCVELCVRGLLLVFRQQRFQWQG